MFERKVEARFHVRGDAFRLALKLKLVAIFVPVLNIAKPGPGQCKSDEASDQRHDDSASILARAARR